MKKLFCLVLSLMLLLSMTAFAEPSKPAVRLAAMTGPTAMGLVKLLDDAEKGLSANQYDFLLAGAADEISPSLIQGKLDIASIPVNLAAILNNKTNGGLTYVPSTLVSIDSTTSPSLVITVFTSLISFPK